MRFQILIFCTIFTFSCFLTGCPTSQTTPNTNAPAANAPKNTATNSGLTTNKTPAEATVNDAPTLKPVFTAYCDAMTKKDDAALRKIYSQASLKQFEADMKADNEKSLSKYLEADRVSNKLCELRNEKIDGDTGVAEGKTEGAPNGFKYKFVRENGEWKLTNESPEFDAVNKSKETSNTAK